jgi:outer membrane protein assembly factor BamB
MRWGALVVVLAAGCAGKSVSSDPGSVEVGQTPPDDAGAAPAADAGTPDAGPPQIDPAADAGSQPADAGPDRGTGISTPDAGPAGGGDWMQYRHDQRGASLDDGTFTASSAAALTTRWTLELGQYVYTQAMVAQDLVVFTTAFSGNVVAVDPATGAIRWTKTLNSAVTTSCGGTEHPGFWAAAAIDDAAVYVASADGHAYALSRADGSTIWSTAVADPTAAGHGEFIQSSPVLSGGKMFLGVASSFHCDEVAGRIASLDLATGAVQQAPLVNPGQQGAAVWSSISVAEEENRLYVTSGNRIGDASLTPNAQAFLAVDADSLEVLDRWQNPTTLDDSDFGSSPTLVDVQGLELVAATSKDGWLYVLRRDALSAGPFWKFQLAVIDPSNPTAGGDPSAGFGSIATPVVAGGLLIAAGGRTPDGQVGSVVAFNPATGGIAWRHTPPGYVIAPPAAAGEILAVESSAPAGTSSALEILNLATGAVIARFNRPTATYAAPSIGHGLVIWTDALGHATALGAP